MFHNSTTIHRLNPKTGFTSGENRMVFGAMDSLKSGWASFASGAKKAGRVGKLYSWTFGGPIIWKGMKYGWQGAKKVGSVAEWGGLTAVEASKGVWGMTGRPLGTLGLSVLKDLKMNLWPGKQEGGSVPRTALVGAFKLPLALLMAPFRAVAGVRDSVGNLLKGTGKAIKDSPKLITSPIEALGSIDFTSWSGFRSGIKNVLTLPFKAVNRFRKDVQSVITPPIVQPLAPIVKPPAELVSVAARSKIQYALAGREAWNQVKEGAQRFRHSPETARTQQAALWQKRAVESEAKKKAAQEAAEAENVTNLSDYKKKKTAGGKGGEAQIAKAA